MPNEDCLFIRLEDFFAARRGGDPDGGGREPGAAPGPSARDAPSDGRGRPERRDAVMPPRALRAGSARA